jgi:hypothetical protein
MPLWRSPGRASTYRGRGTTGPRDLAALDQFVGDRDDIGRFSVRVQREDRVEDEFVLGDVEVNGAHGFDRVRHSILAEEHAADGALLGQQIVRRSALGLALVTRLPLVTGKS